MRFSASYALVFCGLFGAVVAGGCGESGSTAPVSSVAVIDLDAIARALGRDATMTSAIQERQKALNEQLSVVRASYEKQIVEQKERLGEELDDQQTQQLLQLQKQANLNLNQARSQAQSHLQQQRAQLIATFREEIKPIARTVAKDMGISIVVTKNDSVVFTYLDAVDITDDVTTRLMASRTKPAGVSAPVPSGAAQGEVARQPAEGSTQR